MVCLDVYIQMVQNYMYGMYGCIYTGGSIYGMFGCIYTGGSKLYV